MNNKQKNRLAAMAGVIIGGAVVCYFANKHMTETDLEARQDKLKQELWEADRANRDGLKQMLMENSPSPK